MLTRTASPFTISRDIRFWVGQEGCGYSLSTGGMKGNGNQHPVVVPHPQWGLYQATCLLGRVRFVFWREPPPARTRLELESHSGGFRFGESACRNSLPLVYSESTLGKGGASDTGMCRTSYCFFGGENREVATDSSQPSSILQTFPQSDYIVHLRLNDPLVQPLPPPGHQGSRIPSDVGFRFGESS